VIDVGDSKIVQHAFDFVPVSAFIKESAVSVNARRFGENW
jgi:hypothetical protein